MTFRTPFAVKTLSAVLWLGLTSSFPASAQDSMVRDLEFRNSLLHKPDAGEVRAQEPRPRGVQHDEQPRRLTGWRDRIRFSQRRHQDG